MKEKVIYGYTLFFVVVSQLAAMGAPTLFQGIVDSPQELACRPSGVLQSIGCFFTNLTIFFKMFFISGEYAMVSVVILSPFFVMLAYIIIEWILDLIPG